MKKLILGLIILSLWIQMQSQPVQVLSELVNPSMIDTDGERLFILDGIHVLVYSVKDFRFLKKFGKRGEGPGELMIQPDLPLNMYVYKDRVMVNSFRKLAYFNKEGQFVKETKIPYLVSQIIPLGERLAVTKFNRKSDGSSILSVILTDKNFNPLKTVYSNELLNDQGRGKIAWPLLNIYIQANDDRLFVFDQQLDFQIDIYDHTGKKIREIKKDYDNIKITEAYKNQTLEWMKLQPAIRDFSGQVLKQTFLTNAKAESIRLSPAANYTFHHNQYYYLLENEDEEWEIHIQKIQ